MPPPQHLATATNAVQNPSELVTVVDKENNVLGEAPRSRVRAENLVHRCSYVVIRSTSSDKVFVQKRVAFKETYPSFYDPAPGGVVGAGESYEENASREIEEEMGIAGVDLRPHFDFFHEDGVTRVWGRLFSCAYDGPFRLQVEEVERAEFMEVSEVLGLIEKGVVCPDSATAFTKYLNKLQHPLS